MYSGSMGRYGIWGESPYGINALDKGIETAGALGKLGDQGIQQRLQGLVADKAQAELGYMPQDQQMKQATNEATLKEMAARTGLANAQAGAANFSKNPVAEYQALLQAYNGARDDTPEKMYYGTLLNRYMGGGGTPGMGPGGAGGTVGGTGGVGGTRGAGGAMTPGVGPGGSFINPGTVGKGTNKGMQYAQQNPDGSWTYYASPTTANETQAGNRLAAEAEAGVLGEELLKGLEPYRGQGFSPQAKVLRDDFLASFGNKNAMKRLENLSLAKSIRPETANIVGRLSSGGQAGVEQANRIESAQGQGYPGDFLINHFVPEEAQNAAAKRYFPLQGKGVEAAAMAGRTNYPINAEQGPQYAQQPAPQFIFTGNSGRDKAYRAEQKQAKAQPQQAPQNSPGLREGYVLATDPKGNMVQIRQSKIGDYLKQGYKRNG